MDLSNYTDLELILARALFQSDYLIHSVYLNLSGEAIEIYNERQRRMRYEVHKPEWGVMCNFVGPLGGEEFQDILKERDGR